MFWIGISIGLFVGMFIIAILSANRMTHLEESLHTQIKLRKNRDRLIKNQEVEVNKYHKIRKIVSNDEIKNEFAVLTLNQIKEVISSNQTNQ